MNYLLRIINQNLEGCERTINYSLGEDSYTYLSKIKSVNASSEKSLFESTVDEYFKDIPCTYEEKEKVRVIVFGKNNTYVINNDEVAYIVNDEGKTMERIYGQYNKY